jgi:hypothetical protein
MRHSATDGGGYTIAQRVLNLTAGTTYNVSSWVNIPSTSDAFTFKLQVSWRNSSNTIISTSVIKTYTGPTNGWNQAAAAVVVPLGADRAMVQMVVKSLNATIYVDDVTFARP